jgi:large subunit ribosomal protein L1
MSKRMAEIKARFDRTQQYAIDEGLSLLKECSNAKFDESVDAAINLGVDPRKSDQNVRGSSVLPNGTGKQVRIAVFTQGDNAEKAKAAGADVVGMQDLADSMKAGDLNYDVVIASPDAMGIVGQLGQTLGPRGLMPNPKVGTVSPDVATAVQNAKAGQVRYRTDNGAVARKSRVLAGRPEKSQAELVERRLFKENLDLDHHGCWVRGRPGFVEPEVTSAQADVIPEVA